MFRSLETLLHLQFLLKSKSIWRWNM